MNIDKRRRQAGVLYHEMIIGQPQGLPLQCWLNVVDLQCLTVHDEMETEPAKGDVQLIQGGLS